MPEQVRTLIASHQPPPMPEEVPRPNVGFPLAAPVQTPNPFLPFPRPPGMPQPSISMQLRAIELEAVPPQFVIGRKRSLGWLLAAAALVGGLVVIAIVLLVTGRSSGTTTVDIRIDTNPAGASIFVDGVQQPGVTPLFFKGARRGQRYMLEARLDGFETKTKEALVGEGDQPMEIIFLDKIRLALVVTSKPTHASVYIDGVKIGSTPFDHKFTDPPMVVEITAPGFKKFTQRLDWTGKTELIVDAPLEKAP
jgi:hypothetical protein